MLRKKFKRMTALMLTGAMIITLPAFPGQMTVIAANEDTFYSDEQTVYVSSLGEERSVLFNENWKFYYGNASAAFQTAFDDSAWRTVDLPHDYSIEQEFSTKYEAESGFLPGGTGWYRKAFTLPESCEGKSVTIDFGGVYMNSTIYVNGQELAYHPYGYTPFSVDISDYVECDGATENVISVKVDHKYPSSRWYSGSGIYRNVNLTITDAVHVARYGTAVTTPNLSTQKGGDVDVNVTTTVQNDSDASASVTVQNTIYDAENIAVSATVSDAGTLAAGETKDIAETAKVNKPSLWSPENPALYKVKTEVLMNGQVVDTYETTFGFRYISFDRTTGFYLNGEKVKLKGVCLHHDQGALGSEARADAIERQVRILKEMGCNAIRVTHNPAADELLEACNRYGILVVEEAFDTWSNPKNGNSNDYSSHFNEMIEADNQIIGGSSDMTWAEFDVKAMADRGKNNPSVIMWSLGNEILEGISGNSAAYPTYAQNMIDWIEEVDPGVGTARYITFGDNGPLANTAGNSAKVAEVITANGGIVGINYQSGSYSNYYNNHPNWKIVASETASAIGSRGVYYTKGQDSAGLQISAYDKTAVGWGVTASSSWLSVIKNDFMSGEFVWTGFDYIGEPTPWNGTGSGSVSGKGAIPKSSYFGIIDTAGFAKDDYYLYQSLWNDNVNTLHVLPCWDEDIIVKDASGNVEVAVYSDAAKVELYLNDVLIGTQTSEIKTTAAGYQYRMFNGGTSNTNLYATFNVPYAAGTLTAKAYDAAGNEITDTVGRNTVSTTSGEAALDVYAEDAAYTSLAADDYSLSYITVDVEDASGELVQDADTAITFSLTGNGEIVGVDNGNAADNDSFVPTSTTSASRDAFSGKALVIVKSTDKSGSFTLTASADGLASDSITVKTAPVGDESQLSVSSYDLSRHCYVKLGTADVTLPAVSEVTYSDGTKENITISWDEFDKSQLAEMGIYEATGTLRTKCGDVAVKVSVHVLGHIVDMLNYATITKPGTVPDLPNVLPSVLEDGTVYDEFSVTWDAVTAELFADAGDVVLVSGMATVLDEQFPVTASVRVAEGVKGASSNIAPKYLDLTESCTAPSDTLTSITNGNKKPGDSTAERWTNWNERTQYIDAAITMTWATAHMVDTINLCFFTDNSCAVPSNVKIQYSIDNVNWLDIAYASVSPVSYLQGHTSYVLANPINPIAVRVILTPASGKAMGLTEMEVIGSEYIYNANTSADLSEINVDGTDISGFAADVLKYDVPAASSVTAQGVGNAAVTVLPKDRNGVVRIITESEDHSARKVYEVNTPVDKVNSFIVRLYEKVLGRTADDSEISYYTTSLKAKEKTGADVGYGFIFSPEFKARELSNADYVEVLYETFMGRASDAEGKSYWTNYLDNGVSRLYVFRGFVESKEYTDICAASGIERGQTALKDPIDQKPLLTMYVNRLYSKALGREAESGGLNYHTGEILAGRLTPVQAAQNFIFAPEFKDKNLSDEAYVKVLYTTFMGREFDQSGLEYHMNRMANGTSREEVLLGFANSPEFQLIIRSFEL